MCISTLSVRHRHAGSRAFVLFSNSKSNWHIRGNDTFINLALSYTLVVSVAPFMLGMQTDAAHFSIYVKAM